MFCTTQWQTVSEDEKVGLNEAFVRHEAKFNASEEPNIPVSGGTIQLNTV